MHAQSTAEQRAARARKLSAYRHTLQMLNDYVEQMAPCWTDGQLIQALTHVGRQRTMVHSLRVNHASIGSGIESTLRPSRPSMTEIGRTRIDVLGLFGLSR